MRFSDGLNPQIAGKTGIFFFNKLSTLIHNVLFINSLYRKHFRRHQSGYEKCGGVGLTEKTIMTTKLEGSLEAIPAQLPISIPCQDWQVDESRAIKIRIQYIDFVPPKHQWKQSDQWHRLEAHLEAFASSFPGTFNKGSLC